MKHAVAGLFVLWTVLPAFAQGADTLDSIESQRLQVQVDSQNAEAQCYERFAVNACVAEVSSARRARLAQLKKRELVLRELQRAERTREQSERLQEKQRDEAERSRELASRVPEPQALAKQPPQPAGPVASTPDKSSSALSAAEVQTNRAAFDAKVGEAARHKADIEKRRLEQKDRADPLPVNP